VVVVVCCCCLLFVCLLFLCCCWIVGEFWVSFFSHLDAHRLGRTPATRLARHASMATPWRSHSRPTRRTRICSDSSSRLATSSPIARWLWASYPIEVSFYLFICSCLFLILCFFLFLLSFHCFVLCRM
jgi:hypothetical protein